MQLRRFKIRFGKINHIFISHVHGDHVFGLFGLISTFCLLNRKTDLHIYAHPTLKYMMDDHLKYFHETELPFQIIYHFIGTKKPEIIYENDLLTVTSFPLKHRIPTSGFVFREKPRLLNIKKEMVEYHRIPLKEILKIKSGEDFITEEGKTIKNSLLTHPPLKQRSYAYCSDTGYTEKILPFLLEVDLLYHEATYANDLAARAKETLHSTAAQAATIAFRANARKLIIGHFSARYKDLDPLLAEAREIFPETWLANDGNVFEIDSERTEMRIQNNQN